MTWGRLNINMHNPVNIAREKGYADGVAGRESDPPGDDDVTVDAAYLHGHKRGREKREQEDA